MLFVETVSRSMNITMHTNESMPCSIVEHSLIRLVHCVRMQAAAHPKELPNARMCRKSDGNHLRLPRSHRMVQVVNHIACSMRPEAYPRNLWERAARTQFIIKFSGPKSGASDTERTACARIIRTIFCCGCRCCSFLCLHLERR